MSDSGYNEDSIEHPRQPPGGRGLNLYEAILGFNRTQLMGKEVLDLGAGPEVKLAKQLAESGVNANVTEFSPDFFSLEHAAKARKSFPEARMITGLGEDLPFATGSFDVILVLHVLDHLSTSENFLRLIREISRTLRGNGQAHIGPTRLRYDAKDLFYHALHSDKKPWIILQNSG